MSEDIIDTFVMLTSGQTVYVGKRRRGEPFTLAIAAELYKALERLGADPDLLSIIGSYGDTLPDEQVLRYLRNWNETGKVLHERQ